MAQAQQQGLQGQQQGQQQPPPPAEEATRARAPSRGVADVVDHALLRKGLEKSRPSKDMLWLDIALLTAGGVMSLALMVCGCYFGCRSTFQPEADVVAPKKGADARAEIVVREDDQRV